MFVVGFVGYVSDVLSVAILTRFLDDSFGETSNVSWIVPTHPSLLDHWRFILSERVLFFSPMRISPCEE